MYTTLGHHWSLKKKKKNYTHVNTIYNSHIQTLSDAKVNCAINQHQPYKSETVKKGLPCVLNPSCLHVTLASLALQPSSHTVPHPPPKHTSTRPSKALEPPLSLTLFSVH